MQFPIPLPHLSTQSMASKKQIAAASSSGLMPWLKLMRLPTAFTALSNVLCGYYVSGESRHLPDIVAQPALWLLVLASAGLYLGGMVLNDVFDADLDAAERPERPIPSGAISKRAAAIFGTLLMAIGITSAWFAGKSSESGSTSVVIAVGLAAMVVLYDSVLKNTIAAPVGMATCRFLNVMLGASCSVIGRQWAWEANPALWVAVALGVYVFGVTWFARHETGEARRSALATGLLISLSGIGVNAAAGWRTLAENRAAMGALIALVLIAGNVGLRAVKAIRVNHPGLLQKTVGFMLLNIIFIDAAMTFCLTGSGRLATTVVILVIPATLMKRVVPMS
jgi:4-hydroxybenzoate polyprenyltransferase